MIRTLTLAAALMASITTAHADVGTDWCGYGRIMDRLMHEDRVAQARTYYDERGRPIARSTTDSQGTTTLYQGGRAVTRETRDGTVYDAQTGNVVGKTTGEKRR